MEVNNAVGVIALFLGLSVAVNINLLFNLYYSKKIFIFFIFILAFIAPQIEGSLFVLESK
jgi:hypothetical protein